MSAARGEHWAGAKHTTINSTTVYRIAHSRANSLGKIHSLLCLRGRLFGDFESVQFFTERGGKICETTRCERRHRHLGVLPPENFSSACGAVLRIKCFFLWTANTTKMEFCWFSLRTLQLRIKLSSQIMFFFCSLALLLAYCNPQNNFDFILFFSENYTVSFNTQGLMGMESNLCWIVLLKFPTATVSL